jgi:Spy/CpxP family protein refolding chaperone
MLSRRTILGAVAVVGVGLGLMAAVTAFAHGGPGGRHGAVMKRFVSSLIDEALAPAQISPEQRARIYAARDRAFAAVEAHRQTRHGHMDEALRLFEADTVDAGRLAAFRTQREAEHRQVADAIVQALTEVHDVLSPAQRKAVADWIRANHPGLRGEAGLRG